MNLSVKILIALTGLLFIAVTAYRIKYDNIIEIVPGAAKKGRIQTEGEYDKLNSIYINGWFNVTIYKSKSNKIKITGPGELVGYFLKVDYNNDKLEITQKIDFSKYNDNVNITIGVTDLEYLKLAGGAACLLQNYEIYRFNLYAADSTIVVAADCNIKDVFINAVDRANVSFSKLINCMADLRGNANLLVNSNNGIITGTVKEKSKLMTLGTIKENKVVSDTSNYNFKGEKK